VRGSVCYLIHYCLSAGITWTRERNPRMGTPRDERRLLRESLLLALLILLIIFYLVLQYPIAP
jgi:hypothetical protein